MLLTEVASAIVNRKSSISSPLRIRHLPWNGDARGIQRLACGDVDRSSVTAAKGEVCDQIFVNRNPSEQSSFGRHYIDGWRHIPGLPGVARHHDAGGQIEIAFNIEPHSIGASARGEVMDKPLVGGVSALVQVEGPYLAATPLQGGTIHKVQPP